MSACPFLRVSLPSDQPVRYLALTFSSFSTAASALVCYKYICRDEEQSVSGRGTLAVPSSSAGRFPRYEA